MRLLWRISSPRYTLSVKGSRRWGWYPEDRQRPLVSSLRCKCNISPHWRTVVGFHKGLRCRMSDISITRCRYARINFCLIGMIVPYIFNFLLRVTDKVDGIKRRISRGEGEVECFVFTSASFIEPPLFLLFLKKL